MAQRDHAAQQRRRLPILPAQRSSRPPRQARVLRSEQAAPLAFRAMANLKRPSAAPPAAPLKRPAAAPVAPPRASKRVGGVAHNQKSREEKGVAANLRTMEKIVRAVREVLRKKKKSTKGVEWLLQSPQGRMVLLRCAREY